MSVVTEAIEFCERSGDAVALPELLRIKANILLARGAANHPQAEAVLQAAIALSREQGSAAWTLRSGIDLAELWLRQGRRPEARELLDTLRAPLTASSGTPDERRLSAAEAALEDAHRAGGSRPTEIPAA
jgi:predicted ATPase